MQLNSHHSQRQSTPSRALRKRVLFPRIWGIVTGGHIVLITFSGAWEAPVYALEKFSRPLPALEAAKEETPLNGREEEESFLGGYFLSSAFVSNPSSTARPDNTGLVGLRHSPGVRHGENAVEIPRDQSIGPA